MIFIHKASIAGLLALLFISSSYASKAATDERRFRTGNCDNGNVWWSVTEYTKGKPTRITGVDCEGNIYQKAIDIIIVSTDPTKGQTATDTGAGWFSVVQSDALHRPIWMGGMSVTGDFWETTISYDGGTGNAAPGGGDDGLD